MKSILKRSQRKQWLLGALVGFVLLAMSTGTALAQGAGRYAGVQFFRSNTSRVVNVQHDRFKAAHRMQVNFPGARNAMLDNKAYAYTAHCNSCDDLSVAVQVDMFSPDVSTITLNNTTDAVVDNCHVCHVATVALQYVVISDDWTHVPAVVQSFMNEADQLLDNIERNDFTFAQALDKLNALIAKYLHVPLPAAAALAPHAASVNSGTAPVKPGLHVDWKQKRG